MLIANNDGVFINGEPFNSKNLSHLDQMQCYLQGFAAGLKQATEALSDKEYEKDETIEQIKHIIKGL
jgi:hypothetical protein